MESMQKIQQGFGQISNKTCDKNHHIADFTKITNLARSYKKRIGKN